MSEILDDLTARLAAADIGWAREHGDPPAEPAYIQFLATQVAAFAPAYVQPPRTCQSCGCPMAFHRSTGCEREITDGPGDEPCCCPCTTPCCPYDHPEVKSVKKYRKKPVVVEARQFETNNDDGTCIEQLTRWAQGPHAEVDGDARAGHDGTSIFIHTPEGIMRAEVGDWIIRGAWGEFYPCKPDIFEATYEAVKQ